MPADFEIVPAPEKLHARVTRLLARRVLEAEGRSEPLAFPREADLSNQLGVSRTVLRESMKVLVDKGMVRMKPRAGTHARPRAEWRLLDPDILSWQVELRPTPDLLRNLCEVRLAIEPTAAGFAAVRATAGELRTVEQTLERRAATGSKAIQDIIDLDLAFHSAIVAASHNPLLVELSATICGPMRTVLVCTSRFSSTLELNLESEQALCEALRRRDPVEARRAAEQAVGFAMLAVEKALASRKDKEG